MLFKTTPIVDEYSVAEHLGRGAFGNIRKCIHRATGQERAVKTIKKSSAKRNMPENSKFFCEADILRNADHPNIVRMHEVYDNGMFFHIVTEVLTGGELLDYILSNKVLSESTAAHFFKQLISAVYYCHANGVIHRDLKPENLVLDSDSPNALLKVIDFGMSTLFNDCEILGKAYGSPHYIAPEAISSSYTPKCDIWSCGVILYVILSGYTPFYGANDAELLKSVSRGKFSFAGPEWKDISCEAKRLVKKMLTKNPNKRPSAFEILSDKWLEKATSSLETPNLVTSLENLKNFHAESKFQQAVFSFIATHLISKEKTAELVQIFKELDTDGDGKLSTQELFAGYSSTMCFSQTEEEISRIIQQVDVDGNGYIDYSEFIMASVHRDTILSKDNVERAFAIFDLDGSGKISASDLKELLGSELLTEEAVWTELIGRADLNGDGEIDLNEFKNMMMRLI